MALRKDNVFVIGHKNPDTDSICSAIAYAYLKNKEENTDKYVAKRAGELNEETSFVLRHFQIEAPDYIEDIGIRIKDIEIRETKGVERAISLKKAWSLMKELNVVTLPITKHGRLEGLITTEDIAESYMDVYDSKILSTAHTKFRNIVETLNGTLLVGNEEEYYTKGKVLIAAANPDMMENYIEAGDLVILGNRYESQLCAIEMKAGCMVVCDGAKVSKTIQKLAEENGCTLISSPHDTYTVARLINQSMPISYFMSRENLVTFQVDEFIEDIKGVMGQKRFRDFPVLNKKKQYVGMISRRNLINADKKKIIMVDHNEKNQAVSGIEGAEILEIIDHHRLGAIETITPVFFRNQPLGCTATIIYQMFQEKNIEIPKQIASVLLAAILSDTLLYRSPTCTEMDTAAAENLALIANIQPEELATEMFSAASNFRNKSCEEILYQDFKNFFIAGMTFGIGQISSMNEAELENVKERLIPYLQQSFPQNHMDMMFFMLTNIITESTELIFIGNRAKETVEEAFEMQIENETVILKKVVSRKKQLLPAIMAVLSR